MTGTVGPYIRRARPVTPTTILARLLDDVVAREGDGADPDLVHARDLAAGLDPYLDAHTSPASEPLRELERRTRAVDWDGRGGALEQEMLSGHVEGRFLRFLVAMTGARRVLEIGMFTGYSALAMAEALPVDGELVACEADPDAAALARELVDASPAGERIRIEVGPAAETLPRLGGEFGDGFDLVFVDADKAGYAGYLDTLLTTGLLAPHGVVCVDNTLMQGLPWTGGGTSNADAIAAFNRAVTDDPRVEQVVLPLRDGLTLIRWAS
ncbi:class I SAM-dependent methyltransferase [Pseudonocardia nematodicida]|uniref:Class I SAM-dependent methyltransferase n=1 Tax=Pseudonocardia nematodicida TaxID=1206997 RepID=A0ABV1KIX6_9PSEU